MMVDEEVSTVAVVLERAVEPNEIVAALGRYGLTQRDIAAATHVSERTIYAWKHKQGGVRDRNYDRLVALREVVLMLSDSLTERAVGQWLRARNRLLGGRRPVEVLGEGDIEAVRRAAAAFAEGVYV